jgi:hypothetical protein
MKDKLKNAQIRAVQYWFIDGLAELGAGAFLLLLGAVFWVQGSLPRTSLGDVLFFLAILLGAYAIRWVIIKRKEAGTYLRSGYVKPQAGLRSPISTGLVVVVTVILLVGNLYLAYTRQPIMWMPLIGGFILAFIFIWTGQQVALPRLSIMGLLSLLSGGILSIRGMKDLRGMAILSVLTGLVLLISGILARRHYLRFNTLDLDAGRGGGSEG